MDLVGLLQVAGGLFVIYQVIDGGISAADGARVAMFDGNRAELHGLGIEGEQTVCQQFANACEILQCLSGLDGAKHTSDGTEDTCLRASGNSTNGRRFLEHTTVAGSTRKMCKRLPVEA